MSIDLTAMRAELLDHLGLTTEFSNDDLDLLLNRSYWELMNKFPFRETEQSATFDTVAGEGFYATPALFEAIRKLSIKQLDATGDKWSTLDRMTAQTHENELNISEDARGTPTHYIREDGGYRLSPIPDTVYTMRVKYWITLADLDGTNLDTTLPPVWDELVLLGGVWRGWLKLKNYPDAREVKNHQVMLINFTVPVEAKEEEDSPYAGVELPDELTSI